MVPLRAYSGISESLEVALHVYSSRDCSTMRLHVVKQPRSVVVEPEPHEEDLTVNGVREERDAYWT